MELPRTVLGIQGYLVSRDPWDSMPGGTAGGCHGYPKKLSISRIHGTPGLVGLPGTVLGIPGYLVPQGLMPDGTSGDYPGYRGIIPGYLVYQDSGLSWVS